MRLHSFDHGAPGPFRPIDTFSQDDRLWLADVGYGGPGACFGIGASWPGFLRDRPPGPEEASRLVADSVPLYGWADEVSWREPADVVRGSGSLFLGYAEDFAGVLG